LISKLFVFDKGFERNIILQIMKLTTNGQKEFDKLPEIEIPGYGGVSLKERARITGLKKAERREKDRKFIQHLREMEEFCFTEAVDYCGPAADFFRRGGQAYGGVASLIEEFGGFEKARRTSLCVAGAIIFTHGLGPEGVLPEELAPDSPLRFGDMHHIPDIACRVLAYKLSQRGPGLIPLPLIISEVAHDRKKLEQELMKPEVRSGWLYKPGRNEQPGHLIGMDFDILHVCPRGNLVGVFDTRHSPWLRLAPINSLVSRRRAGSSPNESEEALLFYDLDRLGRGGTDEGSPFIPLIRDIIDLAVKVDPLNMIRSRMAGASINSESGSDS
jgi:hypothetical protein